jgi:hypothetical protein
VISLRTTALIACLLALPAARAVADERLKAKVDVTSNGVTLVAGATRTLVSGSLSEALRHLDGREVEVELNTSKVVTRVVSPRRTELRGTIDGGAFVEVGGRRVKLFGPAASLVPARRVVALDVWILPSGDGEACVLAVEGRTTGAWNLVHMFSDWRSPVDVIRSRRAVWVTGRRDGRLQILRGDTTGWLDEGSVTLGEAPANGIVDGIPR